MKRELNISTAREILEREINKVKNKEDREFTLWHSKAVADTAKLIGKNKKVNADNLFIAGLLHDIGRSETDEGHAQKSIEIIEKEFELNDIIKDCILNHSSKASPQTEEGKIIQLADKLFQLNPEFIEILFNSNNGKIKESDLKWLNKLYTSSLDLLSRFKS